MTQRGNSVPPGAPEPKQSVVKRYLPKRRNAIVPMASDCKWDDEARIRRMLPDFVELFRHPEHAAVVRRAGDAAKDAERNDEQVAVVRQVCREHELQHGLHAQNLGHHEVGANGSRHDGNDERGVELLVDLLDCEEYARERRVERRGHAGRRSAGREEAFLSPFAPHQLRDCLAGHAAELDAWSFSSKREAAERAERALDELCREYAPPGHVEAADHFGVDLWDAGALREGLPYHEAAHDAADDDEKREPQG